METNTTVASYLLSFSFIQSAIEKLSTIAGFDVLPLFIFLVFFIVAFILVNVMAIIGGLGTYAERKISADLQARVGPNRVGPYGILQFLADGVKMITKQDICPRDADGPMFYLAPILCMVGVFSTLAVLPISSGLTLSQLNVGVFYLIAISSLVGLGVFLGGYASNSKWSLLGGMRGASQIISYEIPVTLSIILVVLLSGGMSFSAIVNSQSALPNGWFLFNNPFSFVAFFVYFIGALAETNRAPFDLPEAESELVSGYHTEYTGMRFAFFALAEYVEVFVVCAVGSTLFLGGYLVPFNVGGSGIIGQLLQLLVFFGKSFALYYVVIWVRWTLPRLRVDQLMTLCWKYLTPIAIFNLLGVCVWSYMFKNKSIIEIVTSVAHSYLSSGGSH